MSNFSKITKRVLAGALAALLLLTSAPSDVFAGEIDLIDSSIESVVEEQDIEVVADEGEALELNAASEDVALAEEEVIVEEGTDSLMMNLYPIGYSVLDTDTTDLFDYNTDTFQNIEAEVTEKDVISLSGRLKYVTGLAGFSSKAEEQEGNYVAIKFESKASEIWVETFTAAGPKGNSQKLGADGWYLVRIEDKTVAGKGIVATAKEDNKDVAKLTVKFDELTL